MKDTARCYACGKLATHKVTATVSKCRACHEADRASPWGEVARVIEECFDIVRGRKR